MLRGKSQTSESDDPSTSLVPPFTSYLTLSWMDTWPLLVLNSRITCSNESFTTTITIFLWSKLRADSDESQSVTYRERKKESVVTIPPKREVTNVSVYKQMNLKSKDYFYFTNQAEHKHKTSISHRSHRDLFKAQEASQKRLMTIKSF